MVEIVLHLERVARQLDRCAVGIARLADRLREKAKAADGA